MKCGRFLKRHGGKKLEQMAVAAGDLYRRSNPTGLQRVFIGIPVDKQSQRLINKLLKPLKESPTDIRWVPENNRHLTLAFLGDTAKSEIDSLIQTFDTTYQRRSCFHYRLSGLSRFPNASGRIIALSGQPVEPLEEIYQVTRKLLDKNRIDFDQKSFRPHITLARIRKARPVKTAFDQHTDISLDITSVVLYQSTLNSTGSIYSRLKETKLAQ